MKTRFMSIFVSILMLVSLFVPSAAFAAVASDEKTGFESWDNPAFRNNPIGLIRSDSRSGETLSRTASLPGYEFGVGYDLSQYDFSYYKLGAATKLELLMGNISLFLRLEQEYNFLNQHMQSDALKQKPFSAQECSIWDLLSAETQQKVTSLSAYDALQVVKGSAEYQQNTNLQKYTDWTLKVLEAPKLRAALGQIVSPVAIESFTPDRLLAFAQPIVESAEYQALVAAARPLVGYSQDQIGYSLIDAQDLDRIYAEVSQAAKAFWPQMVDSIDNFRFIDPIQVR